MVGRVGKLEQGASRNNWRLVCRVWCLALCVAATSCSHRGTTQSAAAFRTVAIGLCEDYPEETRSLARARADLAFARASGAQVLRIAFGWDAMEPERGTFDWSFWDEFVREAVEEHGLKLIPYVCYTPRWAASDQGPDFWRSPPRDTDDFKRFVEALVRRYGRWLQTWELWNEPDNPAYWTGTTAQFAELLRAGSTGVRAADPKAKVVLGGISWNVEFLEELFCTHRIAPAVDVVNVHSYFETWHADAIETLPTYLEAVAHVVRSCGEGEPLWMAETGYSSVGERAEVSAVYRARFQGEHTPEVQANALVRTLLLALASEQVELLAWYRIHDLPTTEEVIGDDNNRHLGLRSEAGAPKPATAAFSQVAALFRDGYRVATSKLHVLEKSSEELQLVAFELANDDLLIASWFGMPATQVPAEPQGDQRKGFSRVVLPALQIEEIKVTNAVAQNLPPVPHRRAGTDVHLELPVRGGEVMMVVVKCQSKHRGVQRTQAKARLTRRGSGHAVHVGERTR